MAITISNKTKFGIAFIVLLVSIVGYLNYSDKERALVEEYIVESKEISSLVGDVSSLKLIRIRKVGLGSKDFEYKKYFYRVHGKENTEDIVIKLSIESNAPRKYKISYLPDKQ